MLEGKGNLNSRWNWIRFLETRILSLLWPQAMLNVTSRKPLLCSIENLRTDTPHTTPLILEFALHRLDRTKPVTFIPVSRTYCH